MKKQKKAAATKAKRKQKRKQKQMLKRKHKRKRKLNLTTTSATNSQARYWLAINGQTFVVSSRPFVKVVVRPTPQMLIGYLTRDEQLAAFYLFLNAPIWKVNAYLERLPTLALNNVIVVKEFRKPGQPNENPIWIPVV